MIQSVRPARLVPRSTPVWDADIEQFITVAIRALRSPIPTKTLKRPVSIPDFRQKIDLRSHPYRDDKRKSARFRFGWLGLFNPSPAEPELTLRLRDDFPQSGNPSTPNRNLARFPNAIAKRYTS
ncbi:MAG: hypothetical protein ACP5D7_08605 [Limnospira sp.]